jgi:flavin reductase (DIM6/NTAB) family NADH-FMN oxidoreductase RutF
MSDPEKGTIMPMVQSALRPTTVHDQRSFRDTLGRYPTGVAVVSAATPNGPVGMAVNSFTSVSLDPPMIAFCPMVASSTWAQIKPIGGFAVSLLRAHHEDVARLLAQRGADRFSSHDWLTSPTGHPVLGDALAWLDATVETVFPGGDHEVVLARVSSWSELDEGSPLVFFGGGYHFLL